MKNRLRVAALATVIAVSYPVITVAQSSGSSGTSSSSGYSGSSGSSGSTGMAGSSNNSGGNMGTDGSMSTGSTGSSMSGSPSWNTESSYWRSNYSSRPYYSKSRNYSTYEPAYRYGMDIYNQNPGKRYEDLDSSQLNSGWMQARGGSNLNWDEAQPAVRDAYNRLYTRNRNTGSTSNSTSGSTSGSMGNNSPATR